MILLVSARFGYGRLAVHLHMSIGRVVLDPCQIGFVTSQLVFNGAPICIEPLIKIMKVYGILVGPAAVWGFWFERAPSQKASTSAVRF